MSTLEDLLALADAAIEIWLTDGPLKLFNYRIGDYIITKTTTLKMLLDFRNTLATTVNAAPVEEVTIYDDPDI